MEKVILFKANKRGVLIRSGTVGKNRKVNEWGERLLGT